MRIFIVFLFFILSGCKPIHKVISQKKIIEIEKVENTIYPDSILENSSVYLSKKIIYDNVQVGESFPLTPTENTPTLTSTRTRQDVTILQRDNKVNSTISGGQIIYSVPDTMQVAKNYSVIARISSCQKNVEIHQNISGRIIKKSIKTSAKMIVELIDPQSNAFVIKEVTNKKQLVDSSYTEWMWNVSPTKSGDNKLNLVVSIIIGDDVKQTVLSDRIWVHANTPATIKKFWFENWKWSFEKLLIPFLTSIGGIIIGRKLKKQK